MGQATDPIPSDIRLQKASRLMHLTFSDGRSYVLPFEYLRVFSPSAEVQGHGPGQETLVYGKEDVGITAVEPVGHYAIRLVFDDGHGSGLYTWQYLHELAVNQKQYWETYLSRLRQAGYGRKHD